MERGGSTDSFSALDEAEALVRADDLAGLQALAARVDRQVQTLHDEGDPAVYYFLVGWPPLAEAIARRLLIEADS